MKQHYILVKVETTNVEDVIRTLDAALDGDDIHQKVGRTLVCDIKNELVQGFLDDADLKPTRTETR